jgi:hypothetical protein
MTTTPEREAEIIRLDFAEHWRVGTIAAPPPGAPGG